MLVAEAVHTYVLDRVARGEISPRTATELAWRLKRLVEVCEGVAIGDLARAHLRAWQRTVGAQRPASRRAYLSTIRTFVRWCIDEQLLDLDPTAGLGRVKEPDKRKRGLDAAQLARLELVLPNLEARVIVALMVACGLRCCEVARLDVEDVDLIGAEMTVRGKGDNERPVPLDDEMCALLAGWLAGRDSGPVVAGTPARMSRLVRGWMVAAGIKHGRYDGMSAHALRHTAASGLYAATKDVRAVQEFLGHANIATTDRYLAKGKQQTIRDGLNAWARARHRSA